jgi:hypothetical protein
MARGVKVGPKPKLTPHQMKAPKSDLDLARDRQKEVTR